MKVKILIVPLALVIALALMVWLVYPAYSNMRAQKKVLEDKNLQVIDLEQKDQKVKELTSILSANPEKQTIVMKFLPDSQKEEEIFKSLNEIASQEGVSVSGISVSKPKAETLPLEAVAAVSVANDSSTPVTNPISVFKSKSIKFTADLNLYGSYEKIKNVINKIYNLNRFNRTVSLDISHSNSQDKEEISDNLQADLVLEFNYLNMEKIDSVADINNEIIASGRFNMSVADEIQKNKNTNISDIILDSAGKNNPFLP